MKKYIIIAMLAMLAMASLLLAACDGTESGDVTSDVVTVADTELDATEEASTAEPEIESEVDAATTEASPEETILEEAATTVTEESTTTSLVPTPTDEPTPVFSHGGGVYDGKLSVYMAAPEGYVIRYTKNGTVPTSKSLKYNGKAITVLSSDDVELIRAACFDSNGKLAGEIVTNTYVKSTNRKLYTISITIDSKAFDQLTRNSTKSIEKPIYLEISTPDGERVISQGAGIKLFGGSSRAHDLKSFKIIARKTGYFAGDDTYTGKGSFKYALFPTRKVVSGQKAGQVLEKYDSFILRAGGNDSLLVNGDGNATLLRDAIVNNFAAATSDSLDYANSQFAAVYINGEYYGLHDMKENMNEDYVKNVYGVEDENVAVIKSELHTEYHCDKHSNGSQCRFCNVWFVMEADEDALSQGALADYHRMCKEAMDALYASDREYRKAFDKISKQIDLESMIEYYALNLYISNSDWPHNNVKLWRYEGEQIDGIEITDGKWRFMTRDLDMTLSRYYIPEHQLPEFDNTATVDSFHWVLGNYVDGYESGYGKDLYPDSFYLQGLLAFFLRDDGFRADFEEHCRYLASDDAKEIWLEVYKQSYYEANSDMKRFIQKWGYASPRGYDVRSWSSSANRIKSFINERPASFIKYLDKLMSMYD